MTSKPVARGAQQAGQSAEPPPRSDTDSLDEEPVGSDDPTFAALLTEVARAPAISSERLLAKGDRAGEHQVVDVVGRGAFGVVYRAVHPVLGSEVAIKVLGSMHAADPGAATRFIEEARAIHRIRHANIVELLGFGELSNGQLYYAMELLSGKTLAMHLAERGAFEPTLALYVLSQVAEALDAAHAHGVLHRDLKPDNVFVVGELGLDCRVKLLDFGIAKVLGEESAMRTRSGMLIGTPAYMSPEQCGGETVDTKSDIYALGVIAHEMLTGVRLFPTGSVRETMAHHMFEEPPRASSVRPSLSRSFDAPLRAMLDKRREGRPATARLAVASLVEAHGRPMVTLVPPRSSRLWWALGSLLVLLALWSAHRLLTATKPVVAAPPKVSAPTPRAPSPGRVEPAKPPAPVRSAGNVEPALPEPARSPRKPPVRSKRGELEF